MNDNKQKILSLSILFLGIIMFLIGVDTFTYQGNISRFYSKVGMISFFSWLPTLIIGIIMTVYAFKNKKEN